MKREMDELRNAVKDRAEENLDGMIRRTDSPFAIEVLNRPLPPKLLLPQLESFDDSRDPWITSSRYAFIDDRRQSNVRSLPNNAEGRS